MMKINKLFVLYLVITPSVFIFSGCASITESKLQPVSVQTLQDGKEVSGIMCTLVNDNGKWFTTTPGSVTIHKSTDDLIVDCNKDNDYSGHEVVVSKSNGMLWGNILVGGGVGYVVDRNTGAGFDYPTSIVVSLRRVGKNLGMTVPETTSQATNSDQLAIETDQASIKK